MERDLISVIVTVYNVEKYLRRCIDSIIAQTYEELEIILVDDGFTDGSSQICVEYAEKDSRIKLIRKKNGGAADARNTGLENSSGEFIGFVDGDDFILPKMYEIMYFACIEHNVPIAMCGRIVFDEKTKTQKSRFCLDTPALFSAKEAITSLLTDNYCDSASWDKLYRRFLFSEIRYPAGVEYDDLNVTARLIDCVDRVYHVAEGLYVYVKRSDSITAMSFHKGHIDEIQQAELLKEYINNKYPDLKRQSALFLISNLDAVLMRAFECKEYEMKEYMAVVCGYSECYFKDVVYSSWKLKQKLWFIKNYFFLKFRLIHWVHRGNKIE